jgi:outer membrane protein TolC
LLEITALQSKNDLILKTDHSRVEVARDNLQTQIDNMNQLSHSQMSLFKYLVGLPLDSEIIISDSLSFSEENRLGNLFREPVSYRIELQLIDHQIELNRLHRKSIRQSYLPTLSGFGQLYYQGQRNEFDFFRSVDEKFYKVGVVGIQLTIPLFDGFEKKARLQQYDIELQQLNLAREDKINYFSKELLDAIHQYRNGLTVISRQKKNVEVAKEVYHVTLQGYRQQVVSLSDLLMSENELTEADLSYSHALVQLKQAALDLNRVRGELLIFKETH